MPFGGRAYGGLRSLGKGPSLDDCPRLCLLSSSQSNLYSPRPRRPREGPPHTGISAAGDPSACAATVGCMLNELRVENLLLIERAELRLVPGLNVLTGETGAGKTVLAGALDLLLGGRSRSGIVRPGAAEAYVEGTFELSERMREELGERLPVDA